MLIHLAGLKESGITNIWHDDLIEPGDRWFDEIDQAMQQADAAIFLISADFLDSCFIQSVEVKELLTRHHNEGVLIFYVILRPCDWEPFKYISDIQLLPKKSQACNQS